MPAGSLSYSSYASSSSTIVLENAQTITPTDDGVTVLMRLNLDATAQPQVDTVTIGTLPASDSYYRVTIDDYTTNAAQTFTYFWPSASGQTAANIASALAALINANTPNRPDVYAVATTNTIAVTSQLPGTNGAFVLTVACLVATTNAAASGSPITTASVAGSGTGKLRSVLQFTAELQPTTATAQSAANLELQISGTWYNGAATPATQSTISLSKFTSPLSIDALRAVS